MANNCDGNLLKRERVTDFIFIVQVESFLIKILSSSSFISRLESPYHDVSGLPDPYMEQMQMGEDQIDHSKAPQHHMPHGGYDETLESGYSTPNSRNRRVIREIIVWDQPRSVRFQDEPAQ